MEVTIQFEVENRCYRQEDFPGELEPSAIALTVSEIAAKIADGFTRGEHYPIRDINGNRVGTWSVSK